MSLSGPPPPHLFFTLSHILTKLYKTRLFKGYIKFPPNIADVILVQIQPLIKAISSSPERLLKLLREADVSSLPLSSKIIAVLTDKAKPKPELVDIVLDAYHNKGAGIKFVLPVITSLDKVGAMNICMTEMVDGAQLCNGEQLRGPAL